MKKILRSLSRIIIINFVYFFVVIYFFGKQANFTKSFPVSNTSLKASANSSLPTSSVTDPTANPIPTSPPDLYSQLPLHNNINSCWFVIDGHLYDITPYFGSHPGGNDHLLKYCGMDASNGFHTKDYAVGVEHSAAAKAMLQQYLIQ